MYELKRDYFENGNEESEVIIENENEKKVIEQFEEELKKDLDFGYVIDEEYNKKYCIRLFLGYQENWNNYIEMYVTKKNKKI